MSDTLLASLWRASWQGGIVVAALWCFCRLFESRRWLSADLRCWLWRLGYVKLLTGFLSLARIALPLSPDSAPLSHPGILYQPIATVFSDNLPEAAQALQVQNRSGLTWPVVLCAFYLLGTGICLFRVVRKGLATRRVVRAAILADKDDIATVTEIAKRLGLRRVPRIVRSQAVRIPSYAAGTVLLPAGVDYPLPELRLIVAHELAHARRRDLLWE